MPIRPFLTGAAFDPEAIRAMSLALENVCQELGVKLQDEIDTRRVAEKIIQFAKWGIREPETLRILTLQEFRTDASGLFASNEAS